MKITKNDREFEGGQYLSPKEVAALIPGMSVGGLGQLRYTGKGPRYMKPSDRVVVYDRADVIEWLESTKRSGTGEAA